MSVRVSMRRIHAGVALLSKLGSAVGKSVRSVVPFQLRNPMVAAVVVTAAPITSSCAPATCSPAARVVEVIGISM
jgi:hypothetical protein